MSTSGLESHGESTFLGEEMGFNFLQWVLQCLHMDCHPTLIFNSLSSGVLPLPSLSYTTSIKMAPIKRTAGSDFEEHNNAKVSPPSAALILKTDHFFQKTCALSTFDRMPIRIITTHVKAAREACLSPRSHHMVTRAVSTRHSTAAVLQTYELLEAILNELPMQKILEARRVSKSWHTVIKRSKPLRAKLFLEAEPRKCLWSLDRATLKLRPYEWGSRERLGEEWMQTQYLSRPSIANPLLFSHDAMLRSPVEIRALTCEGLNFTASPDLSKQRSIVHEVCCCACHHAKGWCIC